MIGLTQIRGAEGLWEFDDGYSATVFRSLILLYTDGRTSQLGIRKVFVDMAHQLRWPFIGRRSILRYMRRVPELALDILLN